jgi:predicted transcriptional regulator
VIGKCRFARRDPFVAGDVFYSLLVQMGVLRCRGCACTTTVAKVMTQSVTSCRPSDLLQDVWSIMKRHGFLHIPVMDRDSRLFGLLNARDALQALLEEVEDEESLLLENIMGNRIPLTSSQRRRGIP